MSNRQLECMMPAFALEAAANKAAATANLI